MTFSDHTPRRGPRIAAAAGLTVVLIGAGTAIGFVVGGSSSHSPTSRALPAAPSAPPSTAASSPPATNATATPGMIVLPHATGLENGLAVGWPHSDEGAIAMNVAADTALGASFDLDREASIERTLAPTARGGVAEVIAVVRRGRAKSGIAADGPLPAGVLSSITDSMAKIIASHGDQRTVCTWGVLKVTGVPVPTNAPATGCYLIGWVNGDWHIVGDGPDQPATVFTPGDPASVAAGWRVLRYAS